MKATVARFNIVASAVWNEEMALRISKKTTFEILIKKQINGSLTPAVRGARMALPKRSEV